MSEPYLVPRITRPFSVAITLPGSKSIALRQLALAALADGTSIVRGIPECDDTEAMLECLQRLGVAIERRDDGVHAHGPMDFGRSSIELDARMSGASARLLIGLAALRSGTTRIDGHESLRRRTNAPLLDVLAEFGCEVDSTDGCLPMEIRGPFTPPKSFAIDGSLSSQYVTALMIAASRYATGVQQEISISGELVSSPYLAITANELRKRGIEADVDAEAKRISIRTTAPATGTFDVEGDATAATYFAALATLHGGEVVFQNLGNDTVQGDYAFCELMEELGAAVERNSVTRVSGPQRLVPLSAHDLTPMPDAALTLIAMAPLLPAPTTITGLSSLHHKECDRLECPAAELRALGIPVSTTEDSITIEPLANSELQTHVVRTYDDHRMAMAFSLLGSAAEALSIDDKSVVAKTYPQYWRDYESLTA